MSFQQIYFYVQLVICTLVAIPQGHSQNVLTVSDMQQVYSLDEYLYVYFDTSRYKKLDSVLLADFKANSKKTYNQGYNTDADWIRFSIANSSQNDIDRLLMINKILIDSIQFYFKIDNVWQQMLSGVHDAELQKRYSGANIYFPIQIPRNDTATFYLRVVSHYGKQFSMSIIDEEERTYQNAMERTIQGIYIGALIIITLYNIFLGFSVRDSLYFHYALSNVATLFGVLALRGAFVSILGHDLNHLEPLVTSCSIGFWGAFVTNFSVRILNLKKYSKTGFFLLLSASIFTVVSTIVVNALIYSGYSTTYRVVPSSTVIISALSIYCGIIALRKGNHYARFFLVAWSGLLVSTSLYALVVTGIIELNPFTSNFYVLGSMLEVLLLSFALADRYNHLQKEKMRLEVDLHTKERDLSALAANNKIRYTERKNFLSDLHDLARHESSDLQGKLKSLILSLSQGLGSEEKFVHRSENFEVLNSSFEDKLKAAYPKLSKTEIEICGYIKTNLSVKEIAEIRRTSEGAIKMARYRLKSKLKLKNENLDDFIRQEF